MKHSIQPTENYSDSRTFLSKVLLENRNLIAAQKCFVIVTQYDWRDRPFQKEVINKAYMDNLVSQKYEQLRGLYSIPFHFDEFERFIWRHTDLSKWSTVGAYWPYASNYHRKWAATRDQRTGPYYRVGPGFTQHGIEPKVIDEQEQSRRDWHKEKKERDYRRRTRGCCSSRKGWAKKDQNRSERRRTKRDIREGNHDSIFSKADPRDWWMWD